MRMWGIGLAVLGVAVAAWLLLGERATRAPVDPLEDPTEHVERVPELEGADDVVRRAHARRKADAAEERLRLRRGSGQGGFFASELDEGCFGVSGRIVGADGAPVKHSVASLLGDEHEQDYAYADDDGRFLVEYQAAHPMRLVLTAEGNMPWVGPWRHYAAGEHVDIGTIRLEKGLELTGRVVDEHGEPVRRFDVHLTPEDDPVPSWWTTADRAAGAWWTKDTQVGAPFEFHGLPRGRYRLRIRASNVREEILLEGIAAGTRDLVVRTPPRDHPSPADREREVQTWMARIALHPDDRVNGPSSDHPGAPRATWSGVRCVAFTATGPRKTATRIRGDDLELRVRGRPPGDAVIDDYASGFAPTFVRDLRDGATALPVRLDRGRTLRGRLVGAPPELLDDCKIFLQATMLGDGTSTAATDSHDEAMGPYWREGRLDAKGRFEIQGVLPGTARLQLGSGRLAFLDGTKVTHGVVVGTSKGSVTLRAFTYPAVTITCTVPSSHADQVVHWALEEHSALGGDLVADGEATARGTEASWQVLMTDHRADHVLHVRCEGSIGLGPQSIRVPHAAKHIEVVLEPARTLRGRVIDDAGKPIARARVQLRRGDDRAPYRLPGSHLHDPHASRRPAAIKTALDGTFEIAVPPQGTWRLFCAQEGKAMAEGAPIARPGTLTVRMTTGHRITGRLSFGTLAPTADRYVATAWPEDGGTPVQVGVSDAAFFEIDTLRKGRYTITVHPIQDWDYGDDGGSRYNGQALVRGVEAGARGLQVALERGRTARLDVVDEQGNRLTGSRVFVRGANRQQRIWPVRTDGPFAVLSLSPGAYTFEFEVPGKGRHVVPAKLGETVRYVVR